jgi:hypothetical protein
MLNGLMIGPVIVSLLPRTHNHYSCYTFYWANLITEAYVHLVD